MDAEERSRPAEGTLLEQMGGVAGLVYSSLPVLVFVPVNSFAGLTAAIWSAVAIAVVIGAWRVFRHQSIQPAISGIFAVGISAFIAWRVGDAKGFFLFGIYTSLVYGLAVLASVLVRWPIVGVAWGYLNGQGSGWRKVPAAVRAYDLATIVWVLVFAARYLVQSPLYDSGHTGWLAFARIAMGWPLTGVAVLATLWAVRRADRAVAPLALPADEPSVSDAAADEQRPGPDQSKSATSEAEPS